MRYSRKKGSNLIRVLTLAKNRGKGGAVRMVSSYLFSNPAPSLKLLLFQGMLRGRGKRLLFADADGATTFSDIKKLEKCMSDIETGYQVKMLENVKDMSLKLKKYIDKIFLHCFCSMFMELFAVPVPILKRNL